MGVTNKTASAMRSGNYEPGRDTLSDEEFTELRTDIDGSVKTLIAALEIEDDEVYRVGTGADRGPENTSGRLLIVLKDGSGNQPSDNANVELVELTSQNNVERVITSATYGQVSEGVSSRPDRLELPETGPILADPRQIGIRVEEADGSTFTYDLASSNFEIDAVRGER